MTGKDAGMTDGEAGVMGGNAWEIPAFAGMTWGEAGMTGEDAGLMGGYAWEIPAFAGMTVGIFAKNLRS